MKPALKGTDSEAPVTTDEHKLYRHAVVKLQWVTYTRSDICYVTEELARDLTTPTAHSQQKLKHLLRCLQGTKSLNYIVRPASMPTKTGLDAQAQRYTSERGRKQSWRYLQPSPSSTHSATEALHVSNFLLEAMNTAKVMTRIHTDSTSGKSIATRIGSCKKAKHIELKHLFVQQLVQSGILTIHNRGAVDNLVDIFTK